jgi:hypothetical protein
MDLVIYLAMLESDQVANGLHERRNGTKPHAEYYIENKEAESEQDAVERNHHKKAIRLFDDLSTIKKRKVAIVLGLDVFGLRDGALDSVLWKWIMGEGLKAGERKTLHMELFNKLVEKGDSYINISEIVYYAIRFNILRQNATGDLFYADDLVGSTKEQVIEKLMSTQYSDLRLGIQTRVEAKLQSL